MSTSLALTVVASGVATKVLPKGSKRKLRKSTNWVRCTQKYCYRSCPYLVVFVALLNRILSMTLYFLDILTDVQLCIQFFILGYMGWFKISVVFIALPYVVTMVGIMYVNNIGGLRHIFLWWRYPSYRDQHDYNKGYFLCLTCATIPKVVLCLPFVAVLPAVLDVFCLPFYDLFHERSCCRKLSYTFMIQYEMQRKVTEVLLESIPQVMLQVYIFTYCVDNGENCTGIELEAGAELIRSLIVSGISILYRFVVLYFEAKNQNERFRDYLWRVVTIDGMHISAQETERLRCLCLSVAYPQDSSMWDVSDDEFLDDNTPGKTRMRWEFRRDRNRDFKLNRKLDVLKRDLEDHERMFLRGGYWNGNGFRAENMLLNLKFLQSLPCHVKLDTTGRLFKVQTAGACVLSFLRRCQQNRLMDITRIETLYQEAQCWVDDEVVGQMVKQYLIGSREGLFNLQTTYQNNPTVMAPLNVVIDNLPSYQ
jgi:hypothetical protein